MCVLCQTVYYVCVLCAVLDCVRVELCCILGTNFISQWDCPFCLTPSKDRPTPAHLSSLPFCALESLSLVYCLFSVSLSQFPFISFSLLTIVFLELSVICVSSSQFCLPR